MEAPRVHIVGRRNQGKTTFTVELAALLSASGVRVGTIKHSGHDHPVDRPGKDSFRHREAGGTPAAFITPSQVGAYLDRRGDPYQQLAPLYRGCDLVLVEGHLDAPGVPKLEVFRAGQGHAAPLAGERDDILAVISDDEVPVGVEAIPRGDLPGAARRVMELAHVRRAVSGYILAGGRSRRFGSDKARATVDGQALISQVAGQMPLLARGPWVVGRQAGQYRDLGLETIPDAVADLGPMGGLITALEHLPPEEEWALLLPCDQWGLQRRWLDRLLAEPRQGRSAVAYRDERWQPLPALYHRRLLVPCRQLVERGETALWRALEVGDTAALDLPVGWSEAVAVNTPEDLAAISGGAGR